MCLSSEGLAFVELHPCVPSWNAMFMLESMTFKVTISSTTTVDPDRLSVQVWTNLYHRENPEGLWHAINLNIIPDSQSDLNEFEKRSELSFGNSVMLTSYGQYRFTYRVKLKQPLSKWKWAAGYMVDGIIQVNPPSKEIWTQGPEYNHIIDGVYLGNFMAASTADKHGFTGVLNVADNLDLIPSKFDKPILYKKVRMMDGAHNYIPDEYIIEAVTWLTEHDVGDAKLLVNCRAGIGRAGSTVVAYIFKKNKSWSYDKCYQFVFQKRFIYPHRGLKDALYRLFPRETSSI